MNTDIPTANPDELGFRNLMSPPEAAAYQAIEEQLETLVEQAGGEWQWIETDIEYGPNRESLDHAFEYSKDALIAVYNRSYSRDIFSQIRLRVPLVPREEFPIRVIGRHHAGYAGYYGYQTLTTTELDEVEPLVVGMAETMPSCPDLHYEKVKPKLDDVEEEEEDDV